MTEIGDGLDLRKSKRKTDQKHSQDLKTERMLVPFAELDMAVEEQFWVWRSFSHGCDKPGNFKLELGKMSLDFSGQDIILQFRSGLRRHLVNVFL